MIAQASLFVLDSTSHFCLCCFTDKSSELCNNVSGAHLSLHSPIGNRGLGRMVQSSNHISHYRISTGQSTSEGQHSKQGCRRADDAECPCSQSHVCHCLVATAHMSNSRRCECVACLRLKAAPCCALLSAPSSATWSETGVQGLHIVNEC